MQIIKIILSVIFIIDCIALTVVVLMQEGKQQGLGAIAGAAETYWGKRHWENWQCMKILLKKMKKIVKKPDKNSELWLKSPSGYVTMKLS